MFAMIALAFHLYHGTWSMFQSMGITNPRYNTLRRRFAQGFAAVILVGNSASRSRCSSTPWSPNARTRSRPPSPCAKTS